MYVDKSTLEKKNILNSWWILPHTTIIYLFESIIVRWKMSYYENPLELLLNVNHFLKIT